MHVFIPFDLLSRSAQSFGQKSLLIYLHMQWVTATNKLCYITECLYSEPGYFRTISKPFAFLNNWFDCWLAFVSLYWWSIYLFSSTFYLVPLNPREKSETPYYNWRRYSSSMPALAAIPHRVSFSKRGLLKNTAEYLVTFSLSVVSGCLRALCLSTVLRQTF